MSVELLKACVVLDMFRTFIRSGKFVVQLKNEVLYYYNTRVQFSIARSSYFSVFEDCSCISFWALCELLQYFLPNMIVGNIVKVGGSIRMFSYVGQSMAFREDS